MSPDIPPADDGVDRDRWNSTHQVSATPTLSRIKRETICAVLPDGVEPTTLWPAWPLDEVAAALDLSPGDTLVDLGCGRGEVGLWIANHLDVAWLGVDPSPVGLAMAGNLPSFKVSDRERTMVEGHFLATGLDTGQADAVMIVDALHFASDLEGTFAEVHRVLKPNRRLVIVGPQMTDPRPALAAAGFEIDRDEQTANWLDLVGRFLARAREEATALRDELGEKIANDLLARDVAQLRKAGTRHGLIAARARRGGA